LANGFGNVGGSGTGASANAQLEFGSLAGISNSVTNGTLFIASSAASGAGVPNRIFRFATVATPFVAGPGQVGGSGLTIGDNVRATFGITDAFGSTPGSLPNVVVNSGGIFDLSSFSDGGGTAAGQQTISSLSGAGLVTNDATAAGPAVLAFNAGAATSADFSGTIQNGANGTVGITKSGLSTQTLSGNNSYGSPTVNTTLNAGQLNLNSPTAIGVSMLVVNGNASIDNTSANAITLSNSNVLYLYNGDITFLGTKDLAFGAASMGQADRTITTNAGTLTVSTIGQDTSTPRSLTKAGAGTLVTLGNASYTGTTTISSGVLQLGNGGNTGSINVGSAITNNASLVINRGAASAALVQGTNFSASAITGSGSLTQAGAGTTSLTADNQYLGGTTVNAGTLLANNTIGSATSTGAVNVTAGTLGGSGTIAGVVTIGNGSGSGVDSFLSPGNSPGTLTVGSNVTFAADGGFLFEINSTNGSLAADQLIASGVSINAASTFTFQDLGDGTGVTNGQSFVVIDSNSLISGTFANLADGSTYTSNGVDYLVDYTGGLDGNDLTLTVTVVPEPSSLMALSAAAIFLGARRRRRSN
jgi:autotransporter-associated beta strand protein